MMVSKTYDPDYPSARINLTIEMPCIEWNSVQHFLARARKKNVECFPDEVAACRMLFDLLRETSGDVVFLHENPHLVADTDLRPKERF